MLSPTALAQARGLDPSARDVFLRERDQVLDELARLLVDASPEHRQLCHALSEGRAIYYVEGELDHVRRMAGHACDSGFSFALDARHGDLGFHSFLWFRLDEGELERIGAPVASEAMWSILAPEVPEVGTFHHEGCVFLHVHEVPLDRPSARTKLPFTRETVEAAVLELPKLFRLADHRLVQRVLRWDE